MAKYTIEESTLTSIADAIRTQYDDDSPINPLDMAEAILGIEGGGGEGGGLNVHYSSVTYTSDVNTIVFEHDLGTTPEFFVIFPTNALDIIGKTAYRFLGYVYNQGTQMGYVATANTRLPRSVSASGISSALDEDTISFTWSNGTYKIATGIEYTCVYW